MKILMDCVVFAIAGHLLWRTLGDYAALKELLRSDREESGDEMAEFFRIQKAWIRFKLSLLVGAYFWTSAGIAAAGLIGSLSP